MYTPEANGRLEAWHHFFKACVAKHICGNAAEWDEVVPLAEAAYNFFPCQTSKESPFVLMFGRDPITPFAQLLEPAPRYWGDCGGQLKMDLLRKLYLLTAENVKRAREGRDPSDSTMQRNKFKVNDLVLVRDVTSGAFAPKYTPNYRIVAIHGPNRITVRDEKGNETVRRASHLKICDLKDKVSPMVPEQSDYSNFGRSTKLMLHPKDIPDLQFTPKTEDKGEILPNLMKTLDNASETVNAIDLVEQVGEIPLKSETAVFNVGKKYIAGHKRQWEKEGTNQPVTAESKEMHTVHEDSMWFQNPVNCYSMGFKSNHTATMEVEENDTVAFHSFCN